MQFDGFLQIILVAVFSFISSLAIYILQKLNKSIDDLNCTMAKILEKTEHMQKQLDKHEEKIDNIKNELYKPSLRGI